MLKIVRFLLSCLLFAVFVLGTGSSAFAKEPRNGRAPRLDKTAIQDLEIVDGNRISNYMQNQGIWCSHNSPPGHGMEWPFASGIGIDFASGIWMAGLVNGQIRTACAEFTSEYAPGNILPDGTADDPLKNIHQILKLNKGDLLDEGFSNPDYDLWVNEAYLLGAPIERDENGQPVLSATGKRIPQITGDQTLWCVYNDADAGPHSLFNTQPIGLEVQQTTFLFNRPDAFGDMMFLRFLYVNKGGNTLDSAFVGVWFDIDLGDANDDIVFCDTTLSLGGFWNDGADSDYGANPPTIGADFFQGPIVPSPGDTALAQGRKIPDFKNLPMTSFAKYINSGPVDTQDPQTGQEVYNFMNGLNGLGNDVVDPTTGLVTKFVNLSDPEAGTGWIDGVELAASDRRMLMNSGPFTLESWFDSNGDGFAQVGEPGVQEVVVGVLIAQGTDAKNSVTQLKRADASAQLAFDLNFALPPSPPVPNVTVSNNNGEVLLTWEGNAEDYEAIDRVDVDEDGDPTFYRFEGYNVYQVDSPEIGPATEVRKLATFDITNGIGDIKDFTFSSEFGEVVEATVQRAPDTGLQRFFRFTEDALSGGVAIRNWQTFWLVVTAYGVNEVGIPKVLEAPFKSIAVQPQPKPGGLTGATGFGDLIAAVTPDTTFNGQHAGPSDGQLEVYVIDPAAVIAADYQVVFEFDSTKGQNVWHLDRGSTRLVSNQTNQSGDEGYAIVDGIQVKSIGPPNSFKSFQVVANAAGPLDPPEMGAFGFNSNGFPLLDGSDRPDGARQQTNGSTWGMNIGGGDGTFASFLSRGARGTNFSRIIPFDFEMRFTGTDGNFGNWAFTTGNTAPVPFELWNIGINTPDDPSDDYRMIPWVLDEADGNDVYDFGTDAGVGLDHPVSGGSNDPYLDWVYFRNPADTSPGTAGYDAFVAAGVDYDFGSPEVIARTVLVNWNGGDATDPTFPANVDALLPEEGTVFRIISTKPNTAADSFTFSTSGLQATGTEAAAKALIEAVNVFPNPYYGRNPQETNPVARFVTFTHLPTDEPVTIRIFTIAGERVALIDDERRDDQGTLGTQQAFWDLRNNDGVIVASGMYLAHIDMGDAGTKVLKIAVMQPEERLDTF